MEKRNEPEITIRLAMREDLPAVRTFYQQLCASQMDDLHGPRWIYGIYPKDADFDLWTARAQQYLIEKEGQIVCGFVLLEEPDSLSIHMFGVLPTCRRQGLARKAMAFFEEEARRQGYLAATLDVIAENFKAQALYESLGFVWTGVHEEIEEENGLLHFKDYRKELKED